MTRSLLSPRRQARRITGVSILGLGAAAPPMVTQNQAFEHAVRIGQPNRRERAWLERIYQNSGIEKRGTIFSLDELSEFYPAPAGTDDRGPTTAERMARYAIEAPRWAESAARAALRASGMLAGQITHLITVSCTGFFAPGLDAALIQRLALSPTVRRQHIGFMGCHGAFNAVAVARDAILANKNAKVLVCSVELCSLHFAYGADPGKLVANALFADGAAAMVMGKMQSDDAGEWRLRDTASCLLPDSLDAMTWRIGDHGFEMALSSGVPEIIRTHLRPWCQKWLAKNHLQISDVKSWAIHPGGPKILAAVADALELPMQALAHSTEILRQHGNMSSATVLFILQQIGQEQARGPCVAIGLGPGLMAEGMLINKV